MTQLSDRVKNSGLTAKEQAVVEKILSDISNTVFLSGAQLAEVCGVSATFITRLVHKLGYGKFAEFKEDLGERYRRATSPYDMFQHFAVAGGMNDVAKNSIVQDMANLTSMEKLLGEKIEELDREISHKKAVRETLAKHRRNMQTLLSMDLEEISIVEKKGRRLVTVELSADTSFEKAVEMITDETKKYQLSYLHDASYGSMIAVESLYAGNFEDYPSLFIEIPFPIRRSGLHVQPAGHTSALFTEGPGRIWIYAIGKSFPMRKSKE